MQIDKNWKSMFSLEQLGLQIQSWKEWEIKSLKKKIWGILHRADQWPLQWVFLEMYKFWTDNLNYTNIYFEQTS